MSRSGAVVAAASTDVRAVLAADVGPIASQTTLQNITGLALPIGSSATEKWLMELFLRVSAANGTMDLKLGFTVPTGCTLSWGILGGMIGEVPAFGARAAAQTPLTLATQSATITVATHAGNSAVAVAAIVYGGGTAGNVQPQYAQATSDAGNLTIPVGSLMRATKYAT
jgi:hypothetical protein